MKIIRGKEANVHFDYSVQRDQVGIIAKHLTQRSILIWPFQVAFRSRAQIRFKRSF